MKVIQVILVILGLGYAISFVTNVEGSHPRLDGENVIIHYQGWHRLFPLLAAIFLFAWQFSIKKRHIWAWYMGSAILILTILGVLIFQALLPFLFAATKFERWWDLCTQGATAFLIFLFLKKWWLPKKFEFLPTNKGNPV
jgi:hypothetical protein